MSGRAMVLLSALVVFAGIWSGCIAEGSVDAGPTAVEEDVQEDPVVCKVERVLTKSYDSVSNQIVHQKTSTILPEGAAAAWFNVSAATVAGSYRTWVTSPNGTTVAQHDFLGLQQEPGTTIQLASSATSPWDGHPGAGEHHVHVETQGVVRGLQLTLEVRSCGPA